MGTNNRCRIFISYKRVNKEPVFRLKDQIEAATGEKCWIDLDGIESDAQFASVIVNAINACDIVLFMHSSEHLKILDSRDDWTYRELNYAHEQNKRVVIIKLDDAKLTGVLSLLYGLQQQVDAGNPKALERLYADIKKWLRELDAAKVADTASKKLEQNSTPQNFSDYEALALQGNVDAMFQLGRCYDKGLGAPQDYTKAVEWYQKAAEQGHANAQNNLGNCYYYGNGVPQNYAKAVEWYQKAAEQGIAYAQFNLGNCYFNGDGVPQNYAKAVEWYQKAAEQGHADAQNDLGACYKCGHGVPQDYTKAVEWYQKAAEQGLAPAQHNLGICYYNGDGIHQNYAKAVEWFLKASEQGLAEAQFYLGYCYFNGQGVPQNYTKAVEWYRKAAKQGNKYAQERLQQLGEF
jgi:TPR repeat protein